MISRFPAFRQIPATPEDATSKDRDRSNFVARLNDMTEAGLISMVVYTRMTGLSARRREAQTSEVDACGR